MELRNHPQMSVQGRRSWPPVWVWIDGKPDKHPKGEVGVLKKSDNPFDHPSSLTDCF
jgi:hypothetical protein